MTKQKPGLYANIHAKQERIAKGSGEHIRKLGSDGAPQKSDFEQAAKKDVDDAAKILNKNLK